MQHYCICWASKDRSNLGNVLQRLGGGPSRWNLVGTDGTAYARCPLEVSWSGRGLCFPPSPWDWLPAALLGFVQAPEACPVQGGWIFTPKDAVWATLNNCLLYTTSTDWKVYKSYAYQVPYGHMVYGNTVSWQHKNKFVLLSPVFFCTVPVYIHLRLCFPCYFFLEEKIPSEVNSFKCPFCS